MDRAVTALETLGLDEGVSAQAIETRWRELRGQLHPDRGGDGAAFDQARKAFELAHAEAIAREATCATCGGSGEVKVARGFNQVAIACPVCK
jgi:DnaJ-class molecular chaperone